MYHNYFFLLFSINLNVFNKQVTDCCGSFVDVLNSYNKLFEWLCSIVLASHRGGPDPIPGRDISVLGPLG
jgi:hypothetical protein